MSSLLRSVGWSKDGGLLNTPAIEREVFEVVLRPRFAWEVTPLFAERLHQLCDTAGLITITEAVVGCRDPKDDKFLKLAVNLAISGILEQGNLMC